MAVTTENRIAGPYLGDGVATVFPFAFKVFASSDLSVYSEDAAGNITTLVLGSDYTAVVNQNQDLAPGGTITLSAALATGYRMVITTNVPELQQVILTNLGGFYPDVINGALDRLTILVQQLQLLANQSLRMNILDDLSSAELPSAPQRAGKFLYFDTAGNVSLVAASPTGAAVFAGVPTGVINGTNKTFALPSIGPLVQFFWNGVLQNPLAGDYVISGSNIVMAKAPDTGDTLYALIFG